MKYKFNINHHIQVKLTDVGREILKKYLEEYNFIEIPSCYREDDEGYISPQLWDFMNIFGEHLYNGAPQIIENNEIIFYNFLEEITDDDCEYQRNIEYLEHLEHNESTYNSEDGSM